MSAKVFRSKIDGWIVVVLVATMVIVVAAFAGTAIQGGDSAAIAVVGVVALLTVLLIVSILLRTEYRVDKETLTIVTGPFRWRIRRADINGLDSSRSALSSPALSLDRVRVRYGGKKSILVSPDDKQRFARALGLSIEG